jgi:hypothetical protein
VLRIEHLFDRMGDMFESLIEDCVALPESTLDERLRANELAVRRLAAERAVLVGVIEQRGAFAAEHRSMPAYLRATVNCSDGTAGADRRLARLLTMYPTVGDALMPGTSRSTPHSRSAGCSRTPAFVNGWASSCPCSSSSPSTRRTGNSPNT